MTTTTTTSPKDRVVIFDTTLRDGEQPEAAVLLGAAIVVAGVLINIYAESRTRT